MAPASLKTAITICFAMLTLCACQKKEPAAPTAEADCPHKIINDSNSYFPLATAVQITTGMRPCYNPADNQEILYSKSVDAGNTSKLYRVNLATGDTVYIGEDIFTGRPKWQKNGWLLLTDNQHRICRMKADGTGLVYISPYKYNSSPDGSPDGSKIVFMAEADTSFDELCMANADGSGAHIISRSPGITCPAWSPDGRTIAYIQDVNDTPGTYVCLLDLATGKVNRLADCGTAPVQNLEWYPDGRKLIYATGKGFCTIDIATRYITVLKTSCDNRIYNFPSLSADGKTILFERDKMYCSTGAHSHLLYSTAAYQMNADGSNEKEIGLH